MGRSLSWRKPGSRAVGLTVLIWVVLASLVSAQNIPASGLPSGLPDDLSDMSPFHPCQGNLLPCPPPRPSLYVETDGIWLRRDRVISVPLQNLGGQGDVVLSTDGLTEPFRPGTRVTVGHSCGESCWQIDATYFSLGQWIDSVAIRDNTSNGVSTGDLFSPFSNFGDPLPNHEGFDYNEAMSVRELSQFQSAELNLRYTLPMPHQCLTAKLLIGLRYIGINEQFDYYSYSNVPVGTGSAVALDTLTRNDLLGTQIGGEFYFYAYPCCWIDVGIKGMIANNRAVQHTTGDRNFAGVVTSIDSYRDRDATAYVGDLDVQLVWQMSRHSQLRLGYQAIWVNDLALASRNFSQPASILLNGPPQIDTIGQAVYHGPHLGLEFDW